VNLTAQTKLLPTPEQTDLLKCTIERANAACNYISERAWEEKTFRQYDLHRLVYYDARERFGLSAQMTVRCISKVAAAYKLDRERKRTFKPRGAIAYDGRILRYKLDKAEVSIWTLGGRQSVPFTCGMRQWELLLSQKGESDLVYRRGKFYLLATCDVEEAVPIEPEGVLGVDLGVRNIAVDSDGEVFSSECLNRVRANYRWLRAKLQCIGTKSARRLLRHLSGKEARFAKDTNHRISKQIVAKAEGSLRAIALEDLSGIAKRVTVRRRQRATLHSWSFSQLRAFVEYKAQRAGIPVFLVDPKNTSRTCPFCGYIDKRNRASQETFSCVACGFAGLADHIAAENIRWAAVNQPNASDAANG